MREILPGVFVVPQNGGKGYGYSHFVERPAGNLVLDAGQISESFDAIAERGGVAAVVLTDRHMAGVGSNKIATYFGARTYCSQIEADAMAHRTQQVQIDHALPYERTIVEGDVMLVPTPGHTAGQFATLCEVHGTKLLFTADFIWIEQGNWRPGNFSRRKMRKALEGLRDLAFDYVVPWTAYSADAFFMKIDDVNATVDAMIAACPKP
jgi:glyoxylase-like metal-dependent hydrolase (beta-lactamase superfamily II)